MKNPSHFIFAFPKHHMTDSKNARISSRRRPKQARSNDLVSAILEAAIQVLAKEGARRFTTTRVAERAGVSVGSIYQYFPNKASILFRLQSDEWRQTSAMLTEILQDASKPPLARLRELVQAFVHSECEEAAVRTALNDAAPLYRDAPEAIETKAAGDRMFRAFIDEVLPNASDAERTLASDLVMDTLSAVGQQFSQVPRTDKEIKAYAGALADMLCAYLAGLAAQNTARKVKRTVRGSPG
ncbi:transcriptional regulator, TetR family [Duganella sp. CF458]|nr:transcriptional regulator, TetR family [Duganella sp. CF458]